MQKHGWDHHSYCLKTKHVPKDSLEVDLLNQQRSLGQKALLVPWNTVVPSRFGADGSFNCSVHPGGGSNHFHIPSLENLLNSNVKASTHFSPFGLLLSSLKGICKSPPPCSLATVTQAWSNLTNMMYRQPAPCISEKDSNARPPVDLHQSSRFLYCSCLATARRPSCLLSLTYMPSYVLRILGQAGRQKVMSAIRSPYLTKFPPFVSLDLDCTPLFTGKSFVLIALF